jgi:hypothetical protein
MLGVEGLQRVLDSLDVSDPSQVVPQLLRTIEQLHPGNLKNDDVTALLFRPNGLRPRVPLRSMLLAPYHLIKAKLTDLLPAARTA